MNRAAYTTSTGENHTVQPQPRILPAARPHLKRMGLTLEDAALAVTEPDECWVMDDGVATVYVRGRGAYVIGHRDGAILSVMSPGRARRRRPQHRETPRTPRGRGGGGSSYPTSIRALIDALRAAKVDVVKARSGHWKARNKHGTVTFPATPSDHRAMMNSIKAAERELRIRLR